jgi:hypothetical protein
MSISYLLKGLQYLTRPVINYWYGANPASLSNTDEKVKLFFPDNMERTSGKPFSKDDFDQIMGSVGAYLSHADIQKVSKCIGEYCLQNPNAPLDAGLSTEKFFFERVMFYTDQRSFLAKQLVEIELANPNHPHLHDPIIKKLFPGLLLANSTTMLRSAVSHDYLIVVQEFLNAGISPEARGSAVVEAAQNNRLTMVRKLLENDAVISQEDREAAVRAAAQRGHLEIVQELLNGIATSEGERGGYVLAATVNRRLAVVQHLLKDNAVISQKDRGVVVWYAARNGDHLMVRELLNGAVISQEDREAAVSQAAINGYLEVVRELLKDNAVISEEKRRQVVADAVKKGHLKIVEFLRGSAAIS